MERRHLTRDETITLLEQRARDMALPDFALSVRQLDRWLASQVATVPRPSVCRVIEAEFGYPTELLLQPEAARATRISCGTSGSDRQLRTVHFVSWLAEQSNVAFDDLYVAVAERAERLEAEPAARRASRDHAKARISRGEMAQAVRDCYGSTDMFYTARVGSGDQLPLSVVTKPEWMGLGVPLDKPHQNLRLLLADDSLSIDVTPRAVSAAVDRLAAVEASDTVLLDNPLYRLLNAHIANNQLEASLGLTTFAAYALTSDLLEAELLDSLSTKADTALPLRDTYLQSIRSALSFVDRLCAGGVACLLAIAREEDYLLLIQERSPRVVNVAGRLSVIPKAFHQPLGDPQDTAISATLERELEEELLGRDDLEQLSEDGGRRAAPLHDLAVSEPMGWLLDHHDSYQLRATGFGINMLSGNYEFAAIAIVDDPSWWKQYGHLVEANWEARRLRTYSSRDNEGLSRLAADRNWSNEGLFAFVEGLRSLATLSPSRTSIPQIEVTLG